MDIPPSSDPFYYSSGSTNLRFDLAGYVEAFAAKHSSLSQNPLMNHTSPWSIVTLIGWMLTKNLGS
jgi:hypothetical protein